MVIDEADISGCKFVNTLVGDIKQPETSYLLHCKILDSSRDQPAVIHAVDDAICTLQTDRQFCFIAYRCRQVHDSSRLCC